MKSVFAKVVRVVSTTLVSFTLSAQPQINIIPQPAECQVMSGSFNLTSRTTLGFNNAGAAGSAAVLAERINRATGYHLLPQQGIRGKIQLNLNVVADERLGKEGYLLNASARGVTIVANEPAGLFYGLQTFLQLLPADIASKTIVDRKWTLPAVSILDYPRFAWRGLMLDVSRHFFNKEEVMRYIDEMAKYKLNVLHWHLTDDHGWRIEIKSYPKLTEVGAWRVERYGKFGERADPRPGEPATYGGFYTQQDIKEIVQYAQDRYITIVPEVDMPGHCMALVASYPELSCSKNPQTFVNPGTTYSIWYSAENFVMLIDNTLNPADEKVYEFIDKVFGEMAELFPGRYFHAGGDECYHGYWEKDSVCQSLMQKMNFTSSAGLYGYFMQRVQKILESKGKKMVGWDEILQGGVSNGATVMNWRETHRGVEATKLGSDVVMTPFSHCYLDYNQGDFTVDPYFLGMLRMKTCYSFEPVTEGAVANRILGGQGNLWTEQIETMRHAEYMTWPRGYALAEVFWTPSEKKNWDNFIERVERQFLRLDMAGVNYSAAIFDPIVKILYQEDKYRVLMDTEAAGMDIHYTIDGSIPDEQSPKYTQPFCLPEGLITLRVQAYRAGKPIGHLLILPPAELKARLTRP